MGIFHIINLTKKRGIKKKSQSGVEYLLLIGFVTFGILSVLIISSFYVGISRDKIAENQIEVLAGKIISSCESVFYAGEPSKTTIIIYIPKGVGEITVSGGDNLIIKSYLSSGESIRAFKSSVPIFWDESILISEGSRRLVIEANETVAKVSI